MLRLKKKQKKSLWDDPDAIALHYLQQKHDINEYQHNIKVSSNGEYIATSEDIRKYLRRLESRYAFDEMMENPMDQLEEIFK